MRTIWIVRAPAVVWGLLVLYASLSPSDGLPSSIKLSDKLVHFIMYFGLVLWLYFASSRMYTRRLTFKKSAIYLVLAIGMGIAVEFLQKFMRLGRAADVLDALANSVGAVTALVVSFAIHNIVERLLKS